MAFTSIQNFQTEAVEVVGSLDVAEALRIMRQIAPQGDIGRIDDALLAIYLEMSFVRLPQLSVASAMQLFKEHVLFGLNMDEFDLGARVYDRLSITFEEEERVAFVREMLRNVEAGTEQLGPGLVVLDRPLAPTVENWIKEYRAGLSASKSRTGFDEVTFLNKNPNVQRLSEQQRGLLLRLIGFYDGFSNILRQYDAQPEAYLEDNPELELAFINPSPDEWDALSVESLPGTTPPFQAQNDDEEAEEETYGPADATDDGLTASMQPGLPVEAAPIAQTSVLLPPEESTAGRKVPNVQGVLVKVPLGATERTGLEVVSDEVVPVPAGIVPRELPHAKPDVQSGEAPVPQAPKRMPLEDLKVQAKTRQAELQDEIEHKLADLKRKP